MLISLHIENVAVIKSTDIDFSSGFMALTGETGAGKSIIIDSINLLLGAKADKELIRNGEDFLLVSGLFGELGRAVTGALESTGISPDEDGCVLIQRSLTRDGKSTARINGRAVSLTVLKDVARKLVSIHGQSDTGELSDPKNQLGTVDIFAENGELLERYAERYSELEAIRRDIRQIREKESEGERLKEILEYQIKDISSLSLKPGEEDALIEKKLKLRNREKITRHSEFVFKALKGSEKGSVIHLLDRSIASLGQLSDVIPECSQYAEKLRDCLYEIDEIAEDVYAAMDDDGLDPTESLNKIESRLEKISKLKRKYGSSVEEILAFEERARAELETLSNSESVIKSLEQKEKTAYKEALKIADELHERRCTAAKRLESLVKETLEFLDMPKVVFFADIKEEYKNGEKQLDKYGADSLEFFISANRGAAPQPIGKIASGGELARIMLAIKCALADKDGTLSIIFDEIDAGVSGKTARKIGIKMLSLAKNTQLFSVTHSAQIASLADGHYLIRKSDVDGKTVTEVELLDTEGRVTELSRILGGIDVTDSQRAAALDMLTEREQYKRS